MAILADSPLEGCAPGPVFNERQRHWHRETKHLPGWRNSLSGGPRWKINPSLYMDVVEEGPVLEFIVGHDQSLVAGKRWMSDYTARGSFRMLTPRCRPENTDVMWNIWGRVGPMVRMMDQRRYYQLCLEGHHRVVLYRREDEEHHELASKTLDLSPRKYYDMELTARGQTLTARLDGAVLFEVRDASYPFGWAGVRCRAVCRMRGIQVQTSGADDAVNSDRQLQWMGRAAAKRVGVPAAALFKQLHLSRYEGFSGPIVFHLKGQAVMLLTGADEMAAVDLEGRELWRVEPLTNVSIIDLDGPGQTRLAGIRGDRVCVLDAATGQELRSAPLPGPDVFRQNSDATRFNPRFGGVTPMRLDTSGKMGLVLRHEAGGGSRRFVALDNALRPLWDTTIPRLPGAHMTHVTDLFGKGTDEICAGMHVLDARGKLVWSAPDADIFPPHGGDHIDQVHMVRLLPDQPERIFVALSVGHEGLFVYDRATNRSLFKVPFGHVQSVYPGRFVPGRTDLQLWSTTRWDTYGISCVVAPDGTVLSRLQPDFNADFAQPVNWSGQTQLALMSAGALVDPDAFGLIDWEGDMLVPLDPAEVGRQDDRDPVTAVIANVTGDDRDELLLRRGNGLWIYTQGQAQAG